jgi:hypothetical protein
VYPIHMSKKSKQASLEQIGIVILFLERYGNGDECGVFAEHDVTSAHAVAALLEEEYPEAREAATSGPIMTARSRRARLHLFRGFEHELPDAAQIEIYGKVVAPHRGPR